MLSADDLRQERENPRAAFLQFLFNNKKGTEGIHIFVEGKSDSSFFTNFVRIYALDAQEIYPCYICGDKESVYKAYKLATNVNTQSILLFFVDKDLSDIFNENWPKAQNIYVTDYYSMENYLVSTDMLSRVWTEMIHFSGLSVEFSDIYQNKLIAELNRFHQFCLPIMAWYIYLRKKGKKPNLKNLKFSDLFAFTEDLFLQQSDKVSEIGVFEFIEQACGAKINPDWKSENPDWKSEISEIADNLASPSPKNYIYGKLELVFFIKFIETLVKHLHNGISKKDSKARAWLNPDLYESNAIAVLAPRALLPLSLKIFLQNNMLTS